MGLFANGTIGLGNERVSGRSRVPYPPTRISAFMAIALQLECLMHFRQCSCTNAGILDVLLSKLLMQSRNIDRHRSEPGSAVTQLDTQVIKG
jgi:hypothetical protein